MSYVILIDMAIKHYRDLVAWQKAMGLVTLVYELTENWPREEQYGLTSQLRRAAVSVPSNIAESYGRRATQDFIRFLNIAHGSLMEVETQLQIGFELHFLKAEHLEKALAATTETGKIIFGLIQSVNRRAHSK